MDNIKKFHELYESKEQRRQQVQAEVEAKLVDLFRGLNDNFTVKQSWIVDRFNEAETKAFVTYMTNVLMTNPPI